MGHHEMGPLVGGASRNPRLGGHCGWGASGNLYELACGVRFPVGNEATENEGTPNLTGGPIGLTLIAHLKSRRILRL